MNKKLVIGIGGVATSGKDTLCQLLINQFAVHGIDAYRRALADELKNEIQSSLIQRYGINVWNCTKEQKEVIRPELVALGRARRLESQGTFWTNILQTKLDDPNDFTLDGGFGEVMIVPDIRYNYYPNDESNWVRKKNGGLLLHVRRYEIDDKNNKQYIEAPNDEERENDPLVRRDADFSLTWNSEKMDVLRLKYWGFLETLVLVAKNELQRIKGRASNF